MAANFSQHTCALAAPKTCLYFRNALKAQTFDAGAFWSSFIQDIEAIKQHDRVGWDAVLTDPDHPGSPYPRKLKAHDELTLKGGLNSLHDNLIQVHLIVTYYHDQPGARDVDYRLRLLLEFDTQKDLIISYQSSLES